MKPSVVDPYVSSILEAQGGSLGNLEKDLKKGDSLDVKNTEIQERKFNTNLSEENKKLISNEEMFELSENKYTSETLFTGSVTSSFLSFPNGDEETECSSQLLSKDIDLAK